MRKNINLLISKYLTPRLQLIQEGIVRTVILTGFIIIGFIGCGSDEETTDNQVVDPTVPELSKEDLIGTWNIVSINSETPDEFFESDGEREKEVEEATVSKFQYEFETDDSWTLNLELEMAFKFPDNLPDPGAVFPSGKFDVVGFWSGTYNLENSTLSFITDETEISLTPEPIDFLQMLFGMTDEESRMQFIVDFNNDFLKLFEQSTATPMDDSLTLITGAAKKIVLKKQ